jgi:hypothetical protein
MSILYGPIDISSGAATVNVGAYPDSACAVIYNESPAFLTAQFLGCGQHAYPAFVGDIFQLRSGFNGSIQLVASPYLVTSGQAPANVVFIMTYGSQDALTTTLYKGGSTSYPISLNRLSSIGNSLNVTTSATSIVNDGNVVGTQLIESTPVGAPGSTWLADNSGNLTVKSDNAGTLSTLLQLLAGATPSVQIAAAAILTTVLGALTVAGNLTVSNGIVKSSNTRIDISGLDTFIYTGTAGNTFHVQVNPGTDILTVASGGVGAPNGVNFNVGRIKDFNTFTGTGSGTFNHGLSGTPADCWVTTNVNGSTQTVGASSFTSTTVRIDTGSGLAWRATAYR